MGEQVDILGLPIDVLSWDEILEQVHQMISNRKSGYVCFCNVNTIIDSNHDTSYKEIVKDADLRLMDGMPLVWIAKHEGHKKAIRNCGPDFMLSICKDSVQRGYRHYFYGAEIGVAKQLAEEMKSKYPGLSVVGYYSPPYRALTDQEHSEVSEHIRSSGANIIWVGLGSPKQDFWMATHHNEFNAVMFGVGAAFNFHTGRIKRAPSWMQKYGLEWLHRLFSEPRRLWKRYLVSNTLFILKFILWRFNIDRGNL